MDPIARIFLIAIGAVVGAVLSSPTDRAFGTLLGGAVAYVITELSLLRSQQKKIAEEIRRLSEAFKQLRKTGTERAPADLPIAQAAAPRSISVVGPSPPPPSPTPPSPPPPPPALAAVDQPWRELEGHEKSEASAPMHGAERSEPPFISGIRDFFTGGNSLVRAGVVI
ncbi:MAG TPA: hypothetical protein VGD54_06885, partial [Steroidobacteraceae bacterium]